MEIVDDEIISVAYRAFLDWSADHDLGELETRRVDGTWEGLVRAFAAVRDSDSDPARLTADEAECLRAIALGNDPNPGVVNDALDRLEVVIEGKVPDGSSLEPVIVTPEAEVIEELSRKLESAYELLDEFELELEDLRLPEQMRELFQAETYEELYRRYKGMQQVLTESLANLESQLISSHSDSIQIIKVGAVRRAMSGEQQPMLKPAGEPGPGAGPLGLNAPK